MISSSIHDSMDDPPNIQAFMGNLSKRSRRKSVSDSLNGAVAAFAKALTNNGTAVGEEQIGVARPLSPEKAVNLHMKQLRYFQQLYSDNILTEKVYLEQKENILSSLRKL